MESILCAQDHLPAVFNIAFWCIGRHATQGRGDRVAIITDEGSTSYAALDERVRRFAGALRAAGVRSADRVVLILPDGAAFSTAFWGAIAAGAIAVPLNPMLRPEHQRSILANCEPRLLVYDPARVSPPPTTADCLWTDEELRARATSSDPGDYAATHRDAFAFILYSSGTTGQPKGVVHLQHDPWICCQAYGEDVLAIRPDDRCFSVAKLFFAYGLGNAQYLPMGVAAASVLFPGRPTPEAVFAQVRAHRPTLFFGVPTAYAQMLAAMELGAPADFASVRLCLSAGEALPPALWERWRARTGLEILDGIGSTEICHTFICNRPGACRPGSSGQPVAGYGVRLVDEAGGDVRDGEIGDLMVRGDSTMALYWNQPEATKQTLAGEWIRTGDKYRRDRDGFFWHAGRSDDMLKVSGQWVSPVEVEAALASDDCVLECAVVGAEDQDGLVKPHAFVVLRAGVAPTGLEAALQARVKDRLEPFKCPRWITFLPELPKTATGKIQRFLLRKRLRLSCEAPIDV